MNRFFKEALLCLLAGLPYIYLATIWNNIPDTVAVHFNLQGQANGWADKSLLFIPSSLGVVVYLLMLAIPHLDQNKRIEEMGGKYYSLRFIVGLFISLISVYLLSLSNQSDVKDPNILIMILGGLIALLGNYFQTLRPNYFIGIRTPWTLKNEAVWKKTHQIGGLVWMAGGCLVFLLSFLVTFNWLLIFVGIILITIAVIPTLYSYAESKKKGSVARD